MNSSAPPTRTSLPLYFSDIQYKSLLDYALENVNTTLQVALSQRQVLYSLCGCLQGIRRLLKIFSSGREMLTFSSAPNEPDPELMQYISIGQKIADTLEIREFEAQLQVINKLKRTNKYEPFVFVCTPSGTGKTNAAFALSQPFLYFVHNPVISSSFQEIYPRRQCRHRRLVASTFPKVPVVARIAECRSL